MQRILIAISCIGGAILTFWFGLQIWRNAPICLWQHGTPYMQAFVRPLLMQRIAVDMPYDEVLAMLDPKHLDCPELKTRKPYLVETIEFNVRADYDTGIAIRFFNGRVHVVTGVSTAVGPLTFNELDPNHLWIYVNHFIYFSSLEILHFKS